jgi:hypothetical protein
MRRSFLVSLAVFALISFNGWAQERTVEKQAEVFSGPQAGEKLAPFKVRIVLGDDAGKEADFVKQANGKPIVLVFVHDRNRPSMAMTRALTAYTQGRAKDGLVTGVVFLGDDASEVEAKVKQSSHGLTPNVPTGVSLDGGEGPGSYGLNRNVTLTILVGKDNKVTANFALVQPSIQADLPKVFNEIVRVAGGEVPKLADIPGVAGMMKMAANEQDPKIRTLLQPVIRKDAKSEDVEKAAAALEEYAKQNEAARKEFGRIANTIVDAGKVSNYGTPRAQEFLRKWAKEFGTTPKDQADPGKKK